MVKHVFLCYFKYNIDKNVNELKVIEEIKVEEKGEEVYFDIIPKKRKRSEKTINMII